MVDRVRIFSRMRAAKHVAVAVAVGFVLRLAWGLWAMRDVPQGWLLQGDQYSYWYFGNEMANGRGYLSYINGAASSYYPVGYPALLAVLYWLDLHLHLPGSQATLTALLHTAFSTASIVLVYFIARKVFDHRVGVIAAWVTALFPSLIAGVGTYSVETAFVFSALVCVAIVVDHDWSAGAMSRKRLLWFGVALGWSVLIRPFSIAIVLGLAVAALLAVRSWRVALRHVGWALITFAVVLTPWTIRNELRFHRFIPISNNLGDTLCMSRFPGSNGGFAWASHPFCADQNLAEAERNPANTKAAIHFILDHPGEELRQIPKRFHLMMANDRSSLAESLDNGSNLTVASSVLDVANFVTDWYYHVSWILAVGGLGLFLRGWRTDRVRGPRRAIVGITAISLLVIPVALWGNPRFHTPLLPFIAIIAAASISWIFERRPTDVSGGVDASGVVGTPRQPDLVS